MDDAHAQNVLKFIDLAAEIVRTKASQRYGPMFNDRFLLQPGFIPLEKPAIVYVGINPSANNTVNIEEERALYLKLADDGSIDSYLDAHETWWVQNHPQWDVTDCLRKIIQPCGIELKEGVVAWLNVCKVPTEKSSELTKEHIATDLPWLKRQLKLMGTDPFIVLGTTARPFDAVRNYLERSYQPEQWDCVGQRDGNIAHARVAEKFRVWLNILAERSEDITELPKDN
jgi:hypothetical protein